MIPMSKLGEIIARNVRKKPGESLGGTGRDFATPAIGKILKAVSPAAKAGRYIGEGYNMARQEGLTGRQAPTNMLTAAVMRYVIDRVRKEQVKTRGWESLSGVER